MFVFGYGSLMYEPELSEHVQAAHPARLSGQERVFHLRSTSRGCPEALAGAVPPVPDFVRDGLRLSLVLGTRARRGAALVGRVHRYPAERAAEVIRALRRREGAAYEQATVEVQVDGERVEAVTFLSRWDHPLSVELAVEQQARVLQAATPQRPAPRALGAEYLFGVQRSLAAMQAPDPYVESLVEAVRHLQQEDPSPDR